MGNISFQDLITKIKNDPNIEDPGDKMYQASQHMNDESMLYKLAVQWELISEGEDGKIQPDYKILPGKIINNNGNTHIVMEVINHETHIEVITVNQNDGRFYRFKRIDKWDQDSNFLVTGNADPNHYFDLDFKYQAAKAGLKTGKK